jgi:hypothetical protein
MGLSTDSDVCQSVSIKMVSLMIIKTQSKLIKYVHFPGCTTVFYKTMRSEEATASYALSGARGVGRILQDGFDFSLYRVLNTFQAGSVETGISAELFYNLDTNQDTLSY